MKLGYLTAFSEDELKLASSIGFDGLEVHARTIEDPSKAKELAAKYSITITALAHYDASNKPASERIPEYKAVAEKCAAMGVGCIATLTGGDPDKGLEDNVAQWAETFKEVAKIAEANGVNIAFENWPGLGGFPPVKSKTFGFHPKAWELMFNAVDSPVLGLEFDPSHLVWQSCDYIAAAKRFAPRIHHVHLKDTEIREDVLAERGFFGGGWWRYRIPGFGVIDWPNFFSTLREGGFDGGMAIEHEDGVFSGERRAEGLQLGYNYLRPLVVRK